MVRLTASRIWSKQMRKIRVPSRVGLCTAYCSGKLLKATMKVIARVMKTEDRDVLEHAYEGLRSQVVPDLMPSEESIANVLKIMSYEDPAFASIPPFKHFDLSLVQEIAAGQAKGR